MADFGNEELTKIVFSLIAGGLIGFEREFRDKAAGLRTLIFICFGSTVFTMLSVKLASGQDPTRIAANIINGIGFLGAGAILRDRGRVVGLTTAATVWFTAALGMVIGGGFYGLAVKILVGALVVLWFFPHLERWISDVREERNYEIVCTFRDDREVRLMGEFHKHGLNVRSMQQRKIGEELHFFWRASGRKKNHDRLIQVLVASPDIKELNV